MKSSFTNILGILLLTSCSVVAVHPTKGTHDYYIYRSPSRGKSVTPYDQDLTECRREYEMNFERSGLLYYRNTTKVMRDCLRKKGWDLKIKTSF